MVTAKIQLEEEVFNKVKDIARRYKVDLGEIIRDAIDEYLVKLAKKQDKFDKILKEIEVDLGEDVKITRKDAVSTDKTESKRKRRNERQTTDLLSLGGILQKRAIKGKSIEEIMKIEENAIKEAVVEKFKRSLR